MTGYLTVLSDPQNVRFMNLDWLKSHDISIDRSNYDLIYTAPLSESGTVPEQLEKLYQRIFRQESGDLGKTNAVAVMKGYLTVLFDRNDVADAHGGTVKVHGLFQIELLIEFFKLLRHRARRT